MKFSFRKKPADEAPAAPSAPAPAPEAAQETAPPAATLEVTEDGSVETLAALRNDVATVANALTALNEAVKLLNGKVTDLSAALDAGIEVDPASEDFKAAIAEALPEAVKKASAGAAREIVSGLGVDPDAAPADTAGGTEINTPAAAAEEYDRIAKEEGGAAAERFRRLNRELFAKAG